MLVLTRKEGESLYIDNVKVTVVSIDGDKIRIGVDAPRSMRVFREELLTETVAENRSATESVFEAKEAVAKGEQLFPMLSGLGGKTMPDDKK